MPRGNTAAASPRRGHRDRARRYAEAVRLYRQGRYAGAVAAAADVLAGGRDDLLARMAAYYHAMSHRAMGIAALEEGRGEDAEKLLRSAAEKLGRHANLTAYLCAFYASRGRHESCAAVTARAADADPASAAAARRHALALWRCGRREEAHLTLSAALRRLGDRAELLTQAGLFLASEGRLDEARERMARAAEADCTCGEAHYYLGLVAAAQADMPAAARAWARALEFRPHDLVLARQLAAAAAEAKRRGQTVVLRLPEPTAPAEGPQARELAAFVTSEPDFLDACLALPAGDGDEELFSLLEGVVRIAIADHPGYADLHYHRSRMLARLGRGDEAAEAAARAVEINPRYAKALTLLGELHADAGRAADAAVCLERAVAAGADWPDVHVRAARLLVGLGRRERAREHLLRALELNRGYVPAAEALASLAA